MASRDCMLGAMMQFTSFHLASRTVLAFTAALVLFACDDDGASRCNPCSTRAVLEVRPVPPTYTGLVALELPMMLRKKVKGVAPESEAPSDGSSFPKCAAGLGCVMEHGVSRCLRFCNPELAVSDDDCRARDNPLEMMLDNLIFPPYSSCRIVIDGRPEVGLCGLPCRLGESASTNGCPEGTGCDLPIGAVEARCMPFGSRKEGESCGVNCPCEDTLVCVSDDRGPPVVESLTQ